MFKTLTSEIFVTAQITPDAIAEAQALGVSLIINNRPDGESDDQTPGAELETAARAAGLDYVSIPVTQAGFSEPQVVAMKDALAGATGKVLAFCRTGTRSTRLWSLAEVAAGGDPDSLINIAAKAGYDVTDLRPIMDVLKARA